MDTNHCSSTNFHWHHWPLGTEGSRQHYKFCEMVGKTSTKKPWESGLSFHVCTVFTLGALVTVFLPFLWNLSLLLLTAFVFVFNISQDAVFLAFISHITTWYLPFRSQSRTGVFPPPFRWNRCCQVEHNPRREWSNLGCFFSSERKCLELAGDAKVVAVKNTGCFFALSRLSTDTQLSTLVPVWSSHCSEGFSPAPLLLQVIHNSSPRPSPSLCPAQQPHLSKERNPSWQKPWLCNPGLCQLEGGSGRRESSWANGIMVQEMESDPCFLFTHPAKWE